MSITLIVAVNLIIVAIGFFCLGYIVRELELYRTLLKKYKSKSTKK